MFHQFYSECFRKKVFGVGVGGEKEKDEGGPESLSNSKESVKILICYCRILVDGCDNMIKYLVML